ncbi:hypothetical protein A0J61_07388 [Choanephora cucurbitarum]|uniref:Uncharacterized protein n=1 Tax=Choanephora cucurbitarum TaxID=101091 RepID=A0A1C7NB50_9FUNG|nr:hypothetical protein A0J61_07388 [Choanephora cucurbitarum]
MYSGPIPPPLPPRPPRCCGCIPLRLGCGIICLIWAAFSMYMAVLSFQNSSLFYSYMPSAPITVFGVANLILSLVSIGGIIVLMTNFSPYVHTLSHAIFVSVFIVLVDTFVNIVLFITSQSNYYSSCTNTSSNRITLDLTSSTNSTLPAFDFSNDYYNCRHLWEDELKFGIVFYILMLAFYSYWALCIYSYSLVLRGYAAELEYRFGGNVPMMSSGVALPPNAILNATTQAGTFPPNDRSVIVLNNAKPKSNETAKKRTDTFSFRNMKRASTVAPYQEEALLVPFHDTRNAQFTIGFRLGPDGNIIDIENAPSPNPRQSQLKRKPVKDEDY